MSSTNPLRPRRFVSASLVVSALALALTAGADDGVSPIDLSLAGAPLAEVLGGFAAIGRLDLDVAGPVTGTVDVELQGIPWTTALTLVCQHHQLACRIADDRLEIRPLGFAGAQPIDMSLENAPLIATLESFASIAGAPIEIDPAVGGAVTIELDDVPWPAALAATCRAAGCAVTWTDGGIHITPAAGP